MQNLVMKNNNEEAFKDLMTPSPLVPEEITNLEEAAKLLHCTFFIGSQLLISCLGGV